MVKNEFRKLIKEYIEGRGHKFGEDPEEDWVVEYTGWISYMEILKWISEAKKEFDINELYALRNDILCFPLKNEDRRIHALNLINKRIASQKKWFGE